MAVPPAAAASIEIDVEGILQDVEELKRGTELVVILI